MTKPQHTFAIKGTGIISPIGSTLNETLNSIKSIKSAIKKNQTTKNFEAKVDAISKEKTDAFVAANIAFKRYDKSAIYAILAAQDALNNAQWDKNIPTGILIGSSRGATQLWENSLQSYFATQKVPIPTSPLTTVGNTAFAISSYLGIKGLAIDHSVTCSTALQSIHTAMAYIKAGFCKRFIAGGTEAPLSQFTIDQMKALKVYANNNSNNTNYPCMPLANNNPIKNTMVLGEGAAVFAIEEIDKKNITNDTILINGIGYSYETPPSLTGMDKSGKLFYQAMNQAINYSNIQQPIDLILMHAPGTILGDQTEWTAINNLFKNNLPYCLPYKWKTGHLFAASAAINIAVAINILQSQFVPDIPYPNILSKTNHPPKIINSIMINAAGFGGNAMSIIISKK